MSKELTGPGIIDVASLGLGVISSLEPVAKAVPYLGPALITFDTIRLYEDAMSKFDLEDYEEAMNQGQGVLIVTWAVEGDSRIYGGSYTKYYSWSGIGNPF